MTERYIYEDTKNKIAVGYNAKLDRAEEMAKYTARVYKGRLLKEDEDGKVSLIKDFRREEKNK